MAVVRKKQDDKNLKVLRELVTSGGSGGNRCCFDCGQKGPTYVNMTIGSFVCTRCSGVLRGLTPPHRVKSISMATFTPEEIDFLKSHGNDVCAKTWLGLWDPKRIVHQDQRELMIDKYERKRYYLEPASPLKSLTNSAATKAPPLSNGNILNGTSNGIHLNGNSISTNTNHHSNNNTLSNGLKQTLENNLKNITLTPPSTLRLSNNSLNSNSSSTNSNRLQQQQHQQNGYHFQTQFTPEENGFFDAKSNMNGNSNTNNSNNNNNHSGLKNGGNTNSTSTSHLTNGGLSSITNHLNNCQISNKNSLNVQQHSNETNFINDKFTPDSDFVADFGSANIFNAIGTGMNGTSAAAGGVASNKSSVNPLNGFKIHQNGTNHINANNFVNSEVANGKIATTGGAATKAAATKANAATTNGNCNVNSNANANFADFDHASIYNAAVYQPSIYNNATLNNSMSGNNNNFFANNYNYRSDYFGTSSITSYSSNNYNNNNCVATSTYSKSTNNNTNYYNTVQNTNSFFNDVNGIQNYNSQTQQQVQQQQQPQPPQQQQQWNCWQQFQSPLSTPSSEQNRWSLPMSFNSTSNSLSSSATFTSNSSINSTPPADRYAALKDLDDQLRESKTSLNGSSFSSPAPAAASPNPFTQSAPIAITGAPPTANPFQTSLSQPIPSATNIFSTNHNHPNQHQQSLFGDSSPPFSATPPSFLGYNNGFGSMNGGSNIGNGMNGSMLTNGGTLNNGCGGLAYVPQQVTTGGNAVITNVKNPFATVNTLSNSNNPFL